MEDRILRVLRDFNEDIILYNGNYMIEDGIIDSVDVIDLVVCLEDEFSISIAAKYIIRDNFANKESVIKFVKKLLDEGRK